MAKLTFSNSQYGNGTTPENALNNALLQYPEIASTLIQQFARYTLTLLLEKVGLYASEKVLGDNSFEWKVMGRYNKKQFIASTADTSHTAGQKVAFTFSDTSGGSAVNYYNLYDLLRFQDGSTGLIVGISGSTYQGE